MITNNYFPSQSSSSKTDDTRLNTPPQRTPEMKTIMGREVLDTLDELVDPRWTAVIVVDVQNDF